MKQLFSVTLSLLFIVIIFNDKVFAEDATLTLEGITEDLTKPYSSEPGDGIRWCAGNFTSYNNNHSYVTIQTNTQTSDRSIQWGFFIRPEYYYMYSPTVTVSAISARVNGQPINSPYGAHTAAPSYNFHASMKNYQITGINHKLKANDIVELQLRGYSRDNDMINTTTVMLTCRVN